MNSIVKSISIASPLQAVGDDVLDSRADVGDLEGVDVFEQVEQIGEDRGLFKLTATVNKKEMKKMMEEYKTEMKKRKVSFPGFRPGSLPPYVMVDVRKYIVCYALETMLGTLCNVNGLAVSLS